MNIDQKKIEDAVIQQVTENIIDDESMQKRVQNALDAKIDKYFSDIAEKQITATVNRAIAEGFEHEYQRVNSYGKPSGENTTISKELERYISGYWNERVDKHGKATDSSYGTVSRAEWIMTDLVAKDFSDGMKQHIANLGGALKDGLRVKLHETVNSLLSEIFHVKSSEDQKLGNPGRSCIDVPVK